MTIFFYGENVSCDEIYEQILSLLPGKDYGAILTRSYFENISKETAEFAEIILPALSEKDSFIVCMAIIMMSDIRFEELKEEKIMQNTEIEKAIPWNPWHGCKRVSPGCKNCFVYKMDISLLKKRTSGGPDAGIL